ncbi:MAG: 5-aminolevulic acid synthase [Rhodobacteraceae bacterium]|nr:5-aminolevulic acid synthase [Paracoccaceae bacterium]
MRQAGRRWMATLAMATASAALATASGAEAPGRADVTAGLYSIAPQAWEIRLYDGGVLSAQDRELLQQVAATQAWHAALAFAPDAGLMAEPSTLAANHHTPEAARAAAVAACEGKRQGGAPCRVVMEVAPRGYQPGGVSLNRTATEAFRGEYARAGASRAFAISPATGEWGLAVGAASLDAARSAAIAACAAREAAPDDCTVISED